MVEATDLSQLPIDEFYKELGARLDTSSRLIATALELINTASQRIDELEQRLTALEGAPRK